MRSLVTSVAAILFWQPGFKVVNGWFVSAAFEENSKSSSHLEMAEDVKIFLKHVLEKSKKIGNSQKRRRGVSLDEMLIHDKLLGETVQFLNDIGNILSLADQDAS